MSLKSIESILDQNNYQYIISQNKNNYKLTITNEVVINDIKKLFNIKSWNYEKGYPVFYLTEV